MSYFNCELFKISIIHFIPPPRAIVRPSICSFFVWFINVGHGWKIFLNEFMAHIDDVLHALCKSMFVTMFLGCYSVSNHRQAYTKKSERKMLSHTEGNILFTEILAYCQNISIYSNTKRRPFFTTSAE